EGGSGHDSAPAAQRRPIGKSPPPLAAAATATSASWASVARTGDQMSGLRNRRNGMGSTSCAASSAVGGRRTGAPMGPDRPLPAAYQRLTSRRGTPSADGDQHHPEQSQHHPELAEPRKALAEDDARQDHRDDRVHPG